jgi:hypothetical protein
VDGWSPPDTSGIPATGRTFRGRLGGLGRGGGPRSTTRGATSTVPRDRTTRHGRAEVGPGDSWPAQQAGIIVPAPAWPTTSDNLRAPAASHRKPAAEEAELGALWRRDPLVDSGSVGLRMFNLGTIPASVTPPRSWRRAAWFSIAASVAALAGLLVFGAILVGPVHDDSRVISMPYFPNGSPLATIGEPDDTVGPRHGHTGGGPDTTNDTGDTSTDSPANRAGLAGSGQASDSVDQVGASGPTATSGDPDSGVPVNPPGAPSPSDPVVGTLPTGSTPTSAGDPVADPAKLLKRTQTFFAEVTTNASAAADLTTGTVHDDAVAVIHQKYGDVSSIQVKSISLDPNSGLTVSVVRLVGKNGSATTRQTTLHFTGAGDPKITNPGG